MIKCKKYNKSLNTSDNETDIQWSRCKDKVCNVLLGLG